MAKKRFKSGFVAVLGRPNAGKSTLLNALIGSKVSIVSAVPQTTRHPIKGILNLSNAQIVFVDTPGVHSFSSSLTKHLNQVARRSLEGSDLIIYVADTARRPAEEEDKLAAIITAQKIKTIMALNKIDLGAKFINEYVDLWNKKTEGREKNSLIYFIPLSAKSGENIDRLKEALLENLPEGPPYYEAGTLTDFPLKFRIADIIREKMFLCLAKELPHSLAVEVESITEKKKLVSVKVNIYVERNSQKRIVVGKDGRILKEAGEASRKEIEKLYGRRVFLDTWVKVLRDWPKRPRILKELGYWWV